MENKLFRVLDKLFKSWIILVAVISVTGYLVTSFRTLHDAYKAMNALTC